ncbi:CrcB family protein [Halobacteriovorax sp. HLS]|uniref:fluoride efflux transporter FluC n=1 Tax=Halobacteriovorax sp. HLS TaxID=2234000 RepID=UPI000FD76D56|nr:CrcB family protein [Halobacteriovorax sp. HLS]
MTIDIYKSTAIVFLGGGFGASLRYFISLTILSYGQRPWIGTLIANVLGCTLFFVLEKYELKDPQMQLLLKTGKIGSLTTFSTFAFEIVTLIKAGNYSESALVFILNILCGVLIGLFILK